MLSIVLLLGAVSGSPQPTIPGDQPSVWIDYTNDNLFAVGSDDGYTAGFNAGVDVDRWRLGLGYDIFTQDPERRSDQFTATVSYSFNLGDVIWSAGVGGRWAGDLGGEALQNEWHHLNGDEPIVAPYERSVWRPVVVVDVDWERQLDSSWRVGVLASALGSYDFAQTEVVARIIFGEDGLMWIGPRYAGYVGEHLSRSEEFAFDDWGGLGVAAGMRMGNLQLRWVLTGPGIYGTLGVVF